MKDATIYLRTPKAPVSLAVQHLSKQSVHLTNK
jgi:hypothetical protein